MDIAKEFDHCMAYLMQGLGHSDRHSGLRGYCTGQMLPLSRKSVEPMAARVDPLRARARHQCLHHFVAKAQWSDQELLRRVAQWVVPLMDPLLGAGGSSMTPVDYIPRGSPARAASRFRLDHDAAFPTGRRSCNRSGILPVLQLGGSASTFVMQ